MKYKLIHNTTGEEHICEKVTKEDFDYYVSDDKYIKEELLYCIVNGWLQRARVEHLVEQEGIDNQWKKVIATNNPNIDIPKVVDVAEQLAEKYFDKMHPSPETGYNKIPDLRKWFIDEHKKIYKKGYNKSQETHSFTKEDMIKFGLFCANFVMTDENTEDISRKGLLQIWKEQQPIKVYYE